MENPDLIPDVGPHLPNKSMNISVDASSGNKNEETFSTSFIARLNLLVQEINLLEGDEKNRALDTLEEIAKALKQGDKEKVLRLINQN